MLVFETTNKIDRFPSRPDRLIRESTKHNTYHQLTLLQTLRP